MEKKWKYGYFDYEITESGLKAHVGKGWGKLLSEILSVLPEDARIVDIKEKYGMLRLSVYNIDENIQDIIDKAEEKSARTCDRCGKPAKTINWYGWMTTICEECQKEDN